MCVGKSENCGVEVGSATRGWKMGEAGVGYLVLSVGFMGVLWVAWGFCTGGFQRGRPWV